MPATPATRWAFDFEPPLDCHRAVGCGTAAMAAALIAARNRTGPIGGGWVTSCVGRRPVGGRYRRVDVVARGGCLRDSVKEWWRVWVDVVADGF